MQSEETYKATQLPDSIETDITVLYHIGGYAAGKLEVYSWDSNGDKDKIVVCKYKTTLPVHVPADMAQQTIRSLQEAAKDIQAEAWKKTQEIEERIRSIQMLEFKPAKEEVQLQCEICGDYHEDGVPWSCQTGDGE